MFVIVIALEELLHRVSSELSFALFDCFCVLPLLIIHVILIEIVDVDVRHVLRIHLPTT